MRVLGAAQAKRTIIGSAAACALVAALVACKGPHKVASDGGATAASDPSSAASSPPAPSEGAASDRASGSAAPTATVAAIDASAPSTAPVGSAQIGAACTGNEAACSPDKRATLACKSGAFVAARGCKGPRGCTMNGAAVVCDGEMPGDPCANEGGGWCSADRHMMMVCKGGRFTAGNACRGPGGCSLQGTKVKCDESVALQGDPCDTPGEMTCSIDKKMSLRCGGGRYTKAQDCKEKPCVRMAGMIGCD